jgi:Calx-beta domain/Metallo-peptidase family M12B Reprolysin-like
MSQFGRRKRRLISALRSKRPRLAIELLEPRLNLALDVPIFSSLPGANHTIYLDFDGHVTSGTSWNNGATINSPAYSSDADAANFSPSELLVIERTFHRVAEDFAPFQVNVTTVAPSVDDLRNTGGADTKWGVRVVVTRDVAFNCGCGGIAYIDSFDWNSDTPVFVFNTSEIGVAEAASHEVGHALGLSHDGTATASYYQGHGLGSDSTYWSTIMGVGYYVDVSQWDRGEYTGANNGGSGANYNKGPDDLQVITNYNGFGYKADDHGDNSTTATALTIAGSSVSGSGLISTRTDADYFTFNTSGGNVTLNANPVAIGANLDIEASLFDSTGALVATSNPLQALNASITTVLTAGQYYLKIDGVGAGTPGGTPPTGYTDYASLGAYTITGTVTAVAGDALSIVATDATKNESNSGTNVYTFTVNRTGDTSGTSSVNYAVAGSGAAPASASDFVGGVLPSGSLTFAPGITSQVISINVQGDTAVESNEGFTVTLSGPSATTVLATASAAGSIVNDDSPPALPTIGVSATSANKAEGSGGGSTPFVFTITRSGSLDAASSVRYTVSGTGTNRAKSSDFTGGFPQNVLVDFAAGVPTVDVTINVRRDSNVEANETFRVVLSSAIGATISTSTATGTIQNDDGLGSSGGQEEELIAVADPLWMFVPAEFLTPEQLAVPTVTYINGEAFVGDLAHEHEEHDHEHEHDGQVHDHEDHDHDILQQELAITTPLDFEAGMQRLASLLRTPGRTVEIFEALQNSVNQPSVESDLASFLFDSIDVFANELAHDQDSEQTFGSIDDAFGDSLEKWEVPSGRFI